jgi:hypothetical protein
MSGREFDLLCDNMEKTGITDAILVRPLDLKTLQKMAIAHDGAALIAALDKADARFRIVGGHHRFDAAAYLGFETVPCTIITDVGFDEEQEQFQIVRMNAIRGRMDPQAFFEMYQKLAPNMRTTSCRRPSVLPRKPSSRS